MQSWARASHSPAAKAAELEDFLRRVERGVPVLDVETLRQPGNGEPFEVQLSLLRFAKGPALCVFSKSPATSASACDGAAR